MQFDSVAAWLAMGGHGGYVWSAYLITLLVLGWNVAAPLRARRRFLREQQRYQRRVETSE